MIYRLWFLNPIRHYLVQEAEKTHAKYARLVIKLISKAFLSTCTKNVHHLPERIFTKTNVLEWKSVISIQQIDEKKNRPR